VVAAHAVNGNCDCHLSGDAGSGKTSGSAGGKTGSGVARGQPLSAQFKMTECKVVAAEDKEKAAPRR
jgi:hypothetical protein